MKLKEQGQQYKINKLYGLEKAVIATMQRKAQTQNQSTIPVIGHNIKTAIKQH